MKKDYKLLSRISPRRRKKERKRRNKSRGSKQEELKKKNRNKNKSSKNNNVVSSWKIQVSRTKLKPSSKKERIKETLQ